MLTGNDVYLKAQQTISEEEAARVAYLFGSAVTSRFWPLSDIDVGVLFDPEADIDEVAGRLMDKLCRCFKTDNVDLITLNSSPVPLAYRVIKHGRLLSCSDACMRERFEADTVLRYLDFKPIRDRAFQIARQHILRVA